jgi:hypothetical protein
MRTLALLLSVLALGALGLAACGGDDGDEEETTPEVPGTAQAAALQEEIAGLSDEEQIRRVGAAWADPFATGDEGACAYFHPDIVPVASSCLHLLEGAFTGSVRIQRSYEGASVTNVTVMGETAKAEFSNGESAEFQKDPEGAWRIIAVR